MKKLPQLSILFITMLLLASCGSDSGGPNPEITSIQPDSGPPGTSVTIEGKGFRPKGEMSVSFGGIAAPLVSATEDQIQTEVPKGLSEGSVPVEVSVEGAMASGPSFMVEAKAPGISSLEPDSGTVGTEVMIRGMNFSSSASEVSISFDGTAAQVKDANEDKLITEVPEGASDGPVEVVIKQKSTTGPKFDVITDGTLEVLTKTTGKSLDDDGFGLDVGMTHYELENNDTLYVPDLEEGEYTPKLSGISNNCSTDEKASKLINISAGDTTSVDFKVSCKAAAKNRVAFVRKSNGSNDIFLMDPDGSNVEQLTIKPSNDIDPAISHDGTKIAFISDRDGNHDLYIMDYDGSGIQKVVGTPGFTSRPMWSPNDVKLIFANRQNGDYEVHITNLNESGMEQLTDNKVDDYYPDWSPDGNTIAFNSDRDGDIEVYTMKTDGTGIKQVTDNDASDFIPSWSPDGSKLSFASDRDGDYEIYTISSDGTDLLKVTDNSAFEIKAAWSPDGSKLVFESLMDGNERNIFLKNADGTGSAENLTNNPSLFEGSAYWSPVK